MDTFYKYQNCQFRGLKYQINENQIDIEHFSNTNNSDVCKYFEGFLRVILIVFVPVRTHLSEEKVK